MYGIINKGFEDLILEKYGEKEWAAIKKRSGVDIDFFISTESYPDEVTYKLAQGAADELNMSISNVLQAFGEYWILKTAKEKFGALLMASGTNLREFLLNLPSLHNRISLIYHHLTPPEFKISDVTDKSLHVHYYSQRPGLKDFAIGLLQGIGKFYKESIAVEMISSRGDGDDHEIYNITWLQ